MTAGFCIDLSHNVHPSAKLRSAIKLPFIIIHNIINTFSLLILSLLSKVAEDQTLGQGRIDEEYIKEREREIETQTKNDRVRG